MRIVAWNCYRSPWEPRYAALQELHPDLCVVSECARPGEMPAGMHWIGDGEHPLGIAAYANGDYVVTPLPTRENIPPFVVPFRVTGPTEFNLLAVWTWARPTYGHTLLSGLTAYADLFATGPTVVAGDFNSNAIWDADNPTANHSMAVALLRDHGLVSAYHASTGEAHGAESKINATHFHTWKRDKPFHIDYCFVPANWPIHDVVIGSYEDWKHLSDHRPVVVDVDPTPSRPSAT